MEFSIVKTQRLCPRTHSSGHDARPGGRGGTAGGSGKIWTAGKSKQAGIPACLLHSVSFRMMACTVLEHAPPAASSVR